MKIFVRREIFDAIGAVLTTTSRGVSAGGYSGSPEGLTESVSIRLKVSAEGHIRAHKDSQLSAAKNYAELASQKLW